MKYLPTLNLWDRAIHQAIVNGQLRLQCGQWVRCGDDKLSRFVSVNNGVLNVAHGGSNKEVISKFNQRVQAKHRSKSK